MPLPGMETLSITYSAYTSRQNRRSVIREGMGIKLRFARFVGAAAVMVVLLLAPSVASAHAGHHHPAPVPVAHHVTPPENDIPEQAAPKAAPNFRCPLRRRVPRPAIPVSRQLLRRHALHGLLRGDRVRPGSFNTPSLSSALTLPDSNTSDSLDPDGLRRPPRFFA